MKLPEYGIIKHDNGISCCLISGSDTQNYYRVAGHWSVTFSVNSCNKIIIDGIDEHPEMTYLNGDEIISCARKEWEEDNAPYWRK